VASFAVSHYLTGKPGWKGADKCVNRREQGRKRCLGYATDDAHWMTRERTQTELLSLVDVLEPLSQEELEELATRCRDIRLKKGEDFYRPEEHDGGLFFIKEGRVRIYKLTSTGKQLTLVLLSEGTALSSQRLQGLHAQALKPSVIAFMKREDLEGLISKNPEVGLRLVDLLAERLCLMDQRMSDVIHKEVPARLASLILQLLDSEGVVSGEGYEIAGPYTYEELGTMIGAKRVAVTRAFKRLREAGAVEVQRGHIYVRDVDALGRIAEEER
jgi:CRP/FNR family transcriptional regulator, cyclic AMP receptor protein